MTKPKIPALIPLSSDETARLMRESGPTKPLPLAFGRSGVALRTAAAPWAVIQLLAMREAAKVVDKAKIPATGATRNPINAKVALGPR